jgi:hypothetical protein
MGKLVCAYQANKSVRNAKAIRDYSRKHPMAVCMLSKADADLVADAIHQANTEG